jgi:hypothetical protein
MGSEPMENLAAMGVVVPGGTHLVEWRYWPPVLGSAAVVTLAGLAGSLLLAFGGDRRSR